jgi:beta-lactam-binding protein with PASTA domain
LFDQLLPGSPEVCSLDPEAGTELDPGETVTITAAKSCD